MWTSFVTVYIYNFTYLIVLLCKNNDFSDMILDGSKDILCGTATSFLLHLSLFGCPNTPKYLNNFQTILLI